MRPISSIATAALLALALAGCGSPEPAAEATAEAAATDVAVAPSAAVTQPPPGEYEVTMADGKKGKTTINADGSYTDVVGDGLPEAGIVTFTGGKTCFDPSGDKPAECWTESPRAADGSFTATSDSGEKVTVRPMAKQG